MLLFPFIMRNLWLQSHTAMSVWTKAQILSDLFPCPLFACHWVSFLEFEQGVAETHDRLISVTFHMYIFDDDDDNGSRFT